MKTEKLRLALAFDLGHYPEKYDENPEIIGLNKLLTEYKPNANILVIENEKRTESESKILSVIEEKHNPTYKNFNDLGILGEESTQYDLVICSGIASLQGDVLNDFMTYLKRRTTNGSKVLFLVEGNIFASLKGLMSKEFKPPFELLSTNSEEGIILKRIASENEKNTTDSPSPKKKKKK